MDYNTVIHLINRFDGIASEESVSIPSVGYGQSIYNVGDIIAPRFISQPIVGNTQFISIPDSVAIYDKEKVSIPTYTLPQPAYTLPDSILTAEILPTDSYIILPITPAGILTAEIFSTAVMAYGVNPDSILSVESLSVDSIIEQPLYWDITGGNYDTSYSIFPQDFNPTGVSFSVDGSIMYMVGGSDRVYEYNLDTPWDIDSASYDDKFFSIGTETGSPTDIYFRSDGYKMYISESSGDRVYEYDLTTPWDIDSASYDDKFADVGESTVPTAVEFSNTGYRMYVSDWNTDNIFQYDLAVAWDVSTATYNDDYFFSGGGTNPPAIRFNPEGTQLFLISGGYVNGYELSTAWDITTVVYSGNRLSINVIENSYSGFYIGNNGTMLYAIESYIDTVRQYIL